MILGELGGRFLNDRIMNFTVRKNKGIFVAESRLWWVQNVGYHLAAADRTCILQGMLCSNAIVHLRLLDIGSWYSAFK